MVVENSEMSCNTFLFFLSVFSFLPLLFLHYFSSQTNTICTSPERGLPVPVSAPPRASLFDMASTLLVSTGQIRQHAEGSRERERAREMKLLLSSPPLACSSNHCDSRASTVDMFQL